MMGKIFIIALVVIATDVLGCQPESGTYTIRVIHNNDFHSRFDGTTRTGMECDPKEMNKCYGKISRWQETTNKILKSGPNTLYLYAGDMFQGSLFFIKYGAEMVAKLTKGLNFTAAALGNHEFDNGISDLMKFIKAVPFPIVCANLDASSEPRLKDFVKKSVIREVNGVKVGIIGYLTPETMSISKAEKAKFVDEVEAIREEARRLKQENKVVHIFAVGHSGINVDQKIAKEVEEIDLVVGGHTNTFLYNGASPFGDKMVPEGPYPILVKQNSGKIVPVVQAYAYGVFMGNLTMEFYKNGTLRQAYGQPVLMDEKLPIDSKLQEEVDRVNADLEQFKKDVIGYTTIELEGGKQPCRLRECTMGNYIADMLEKFSIKEFVETYKLGKQWTGFAVTLVNGGAFKQAIRTGNVTRADVLNAMPYPNDLCISNITGKILLQVLQRSVSQIIAADPEGRFMQLSGVRAVYNVSRPQGDRLVSVKVRCQDCVIPKYVDIDENKYYTILTTDYVATGSDGFDMLKGIPYINSGYRLVDLAMESFKNSVVYVELTDRSSVLSLNKAASEEKFTGTLLTTLH